MSMKMFLLGMLTMYLGTTIITTIASVWIDTDDYLYFIATDDSLWRDICASFGKIVKIWGE